ncbi:MAG TPA: glycine betaine ABC transporter substrate-binding protein [Rhizobiaceae bacterium]|nr:glycine betaine ABC transporter substrate-binding protein [Rhizobiaceae bacterium]
MAALSGAAALLLFSHGATAQECGEVKIAEMNWRSAGLAANVDKLILEAAFGCKVTLVGGDTLSTFNAMNEDKGPDIAPEVWVNAIKEQLDKAVADNRLSIGAEILLDGGVEGWWIPKYIADTNPQVKKISDALARPELFPAPFDKTVGAIHSCPDGWACRVATKNLACAYGSEEKRFRLVEPFSPEQMEQSLREAYGKQEGWLGYYWAPTALMGELPMVRLEFDVEHDIAEWDGCTTVPDCPEPKINAWPRSEVFTVMTTEFAAEANAVTDYLRQRAWDNATVNAVLAWMVRTGATNEQAAKYFLSNRPEIWTRWVSGEAADRIRAAL